MTRLLELAVRTGHITNARPESVILVGPPGHGKTTLLQRVARASVVVTYADATLHELLGVAKRAQRGDVTHVLLPELQRLAMRRGFVAEQALAFLSGAMEEGLDRVAYGRTSIEFAGTRFGILAAITPDALDYLGSKLKHVGLFSRGLWVPWELTAAELDQVSENVRTGNIRDTHPVPMTRLNGTRPTITVHPAAGTQLLAMARRLRPHDVRFYKQLIGLAQAVADEAKAKVVTVKHVAQLAPFEPFFATTKRDA